MDKMIEIEKYLKDKGIEFEKSEHHAMFAVEEADKLHIHNTHGGIHAKNLFLKEKKRKEFYLVILPSNKKLELKELENKLKQKLRFASEEELKNILGLTSGAVTPFGLINDKEAKVHLMIDKEIIELEHVNFHSNINATILNISKNNFKKY